MSAVRTPGIPCQPSSSSVESSGYVEPSSSSSSPLLLPGTRSSILARRLAPLRGRGGQTRAVKRRKREMIPACRKDASYWDKRRKNNEAAKRSREKRRFNDLLLEGQLLALSEENVQLRSQLLNLHYHTSFSKKNHPPSHFAAPASVLANTLSLSSIPVSPSPALLQPGPWDIPRLSSTRGVFNSLNHCRPQQGSVPVSKPRVVSHGGPVGVGRSVEAQMDPVSSSDDILTSADAISRTYASLPSFLPTFDNTLQQHIPMIPPRPAPPTWMVSHLHHSALRNNLLPNWRSSYLQASPAGYPGFSFP